jgi:diguanylate cyclase
MGIGIWSMHFVGMLAMSLPVPISYDVLITFVSLVIAIVASTYALSIASRETIARSALFSSGIVMGIGICSMHYVGMAAVEIEPGISYRWGWVVASFVIAVVASLGAIWMVFTAQGESGWWRHRRIWGAIGMGLAIAGMHYTGMTAARFPADAMTEATAPVNNAWLAGAVSIFTLLLLLATLLVSFLEANAGRHAARMRDSLSEEKESSRAKDQFLAMLGHELRNPLAAISNAIFLLDRADPASREWRFAREVIGRQTTHLTRMVDDLLDVGRAVTGKLSIDPGPVDLGAAVEASVNAIRTDRRFGHRRLECRATAVWIEADRTRIEQVATNLLNNAVQHTPADGTIQVQVNATDAHAELIVSDNGFGMDAETLARAFELFFQAEQGVDRRRGGLGLGLTLVRRLVAMHGGTVSAASDGLGKGSTFTVRLPRIPAPADTAESGPSSTQRRGRSVVVVEDAMDSLLSLQQILQSQGHAVRTATDGVSGLGAIVKWKPDVAIVDIGLPGLSGYEIAERIRASGMSTYLVALSGFGQDEDKVKARRAGFDVHLTKPTDPAHLLEIVCGS